MSVTFLPSVHGFKFNNDFPHMPDLILNLPLVGKVVMGDAANGLCGGMVYLALDYFRSGVPIPDAPNPPGDTTELFHHIFARLWDSFDLPWGPLKYYRWQSSPDTEWLLRQSQRELQKLRRVLAKQGPVPIGMIRHHSLNPLELGQNHQLLCYAEEGGTLSLYDPDYAGRDDIRLMLDDAGLRHSEDGEQRGFFVTDYRHEEV